MTRVLVFVVATTFVLGCRDYEQRARGTGAAVRDGIVSACAKESQAHDGGVEEEEECGEQRCRAACSGPDVAKGFAATCVHECRSTGTCATDADCASGLHCIALAPRVRRCAARP